MFKLKIQTVDVLEDSAAKLLNAFPDKRIFAFYGEMGVGKTTFIKAICKVLKVVDDTSSPTFGLINEYRLEEGNFVYHFDFYRVETVEELYDIGYEEYLYSDNYCLMEWPENVEAILPEDTIRISMISGDDEVRELFLID